MINEAFKYCKDYVFNLTVIQIILMSVPLLMYLLMGSQWLHIFPQKGSLINYIPVDFDKNFSGIEILSGAGYYLIIIFTFSLNKTGIKFLLPLYIFGSYLMYFSLADFLESQKPAVFADRIIKWFDYELLFSFYCFAGTYMMAMIVSVILLFGKNKADAYTK